MVRILLIELETLFSKLLLPRVSLRSWLTKGQRVPLEILESVGGVKVD